VRRPACSEALTLGVEPLILTLAETGSTSDWLRANAAQFGDGQWVRAERQTAGRGRLGRVWEMPAGNLAMSGLIRLQPGEGPAAELGFVAALALHEVVSAHVEPGRLQLKWPNDLLLDGAKLSGILLEQEAGLLVLGIGVNVAAAPVLPGRATVSLREAGAAVEAERLAQALAAAFSRWRGVWRSQGFGAIRTAWLARAHPLGTRLWLRGDPPREGAFAGIAEDGALLLDGVDGRHMVHAGDVWTMAGGEG
jgi:BirA family biotin operon repressor/biotin-[acetyl-CoA-carboxylase] ligase